MTRESRDVLEYMSHVTIMRLHWFEGYKPFFFPLAWFLKQLCPSIPPQLVVKVSILLLDIVTAVIWYRIARRISYFRLSKNNKGFAAKWVARPTFLASIYLLNPFAIMYNEACNSDGARYFWVTFAMYTAIKQYADYELNILLYAVFQFATIMMVQNATFKMIAVVLPLCYVVVFNRLRLTNNIAISMRQLGHILWYIIPHVVTTVSLFFAYNIATDVFSVYRTMEMDYAARGKGIDYSLFWYLQRVLPDVFEVGNVFKSHAIIFLFPFPLMLVLRHRPLEYLFTMVNIAIIQQPGLTVLGVWYVICVLAIQYPLLDRTLGFTKLVIVMLMCEILTFFAYAAWAGFNIANPNFYFFPHLLIFFIMCIILEDYSTITFVMATREEIEERKMKLEMEERMKKQKCCCHHGH
ncbi:hypothetical protein BgAZ_109100 [Babesia gibsoni]|uniref:GPI transamidase subunit PIG-U n=1 Tax=Babesia gibsoni TaxID=33632 RepID=A0AAD8UWJ5_BABGI|nr:hypothetical protein BgAZ_109100 [Babesia gibsoni]